MRQLFLLPGLVFATSLLSGTFDLQALFSNTSVSPFVAQAPESAAGALLDQVIDAFSAERVHWLDMIVWQRMGGDEAYQAEGRFLAGPGERMRLDLKIAVDGRTGYVRAASDGRQLCQAQWVDGQQPAPQAFTLTTSEGSQPTPLALARARQGVLEAHGCGGLVPLLRQVRSGLLKPSRQPGLWQNHPVIKLSGSWNASEDLLRTLPANLRARQCNLILDAATLWPFRIEWVGGGGAHPVLLLQMEFRNPVINRALTDVEAARQFRFGPA